MVTDWRAEEQKRVERAEKAHWFWAAFGITVGLMLTGVASFGIGSCVHRNWAFEDACAKLGGHTMSYPTRCEVIVSPEVRRVIAVPNFKW